MLSKNIFPLIFLGYFSKPKNVSMKKQITSFWIPKKMRLVYYKFTWNSNLGLSFIYILNSRLKLVFIWVNQWNAFMYKEAC